MSLPHLIKYIYNNGTDEVIKRGKKIHATYQSEIIEYDELLGNVLFRVKDDNYATFYKVSISRFKDSKQMLVRCSCPYNLGEICRHEVAALFQLQDLIDKNMLGERDVVYDQKHTVVKMKQLELKVVRMLTNTLVYEAAEEFIRNNSANILSAQDERVQAELEYEGVLYKVVIYKNEERNFDTSCTCKSETHHPLCLHKAIVLLQLINTYGANYFDSIRNWDKEKNKLLALYGYTLEDDLKGKFEFSYKDGKPYLRVLDTSIKRVAPGSFMPKPQPIIVAEIEEEEAVETEAAKTKPQIRLGIVLRKQPHQYPFISFDLVQGVNNEEDDAFLGKVEKLDLSKFINTDPLNEEDKQLVQQLRKLLPGEVSRYLNRNSPFSGIWENIVQQNNDDLPEDTRSLIAEYLVPKFKKILSEYHDSHYTFYLPGGKPFVTAELQKIAFSQSFATPLFYVNATADGYEIICNVKAGYLEYSLTDNELHTAMLFMQNHTVYSWEKSEDVVLVEKFLPNGIKKVTKEQWPQVLQNEILPLSKEYNVQFNNVAKKEITNSKPTLKMHLKEKGDYLLFQPVFNYQGYDVREQDGQKVIVPQAHELLIIHRNTEEERNLLNKILNLHSSFIKPESSNTLALKGTEVLKNNWFFLFVDAMKEMEIPVYGFDSLKNFKFNTAKPSTKIYISSHTDWFDAKVDIMFGDQKITVADVKRALANKQQYVQLQDGTLGILPEEWIKKYSLLFRVGEGKASNMKLSRFHVSVIEELYEQRDEEELFVQLEEKYDKIRQTDAIEDIPAPQHLQPILRPYQVSGFQWLNYLSNVQWGGILADDMGLGKTIQALSFLHHFKESKGHLKALVVCPTTLMYNWENEIKKFTPDLTYHIHHGGSRSKEDLHQPNTNVIITTYGTLRSDIKHLIEIMFDYVVLDESQAIKNPSSKVTKAASLLRAQNRLCMSGTPLQNNTFDIFAQMNFLNPGMLGSIEHFKQEFAIPIDKFGEKEQKEHLRKLLFPFILRRTKEQVAKDLPEKQEMILFCEMGDEQRKIYDAFRNDFRDKIMGVVNDQGIAKSQLTILQGLMKLRQICDSPYIMNEEEKYPNVSVKLEELGREITENISNHKALIFSQFLGMLGLIREKMEELGVDYEYFDGSSTALERERAIQRFQKEDSCRVFLISLKAGGVGLNLTAADYVYIVDPWWNPAVEQQAIDRTHRIGQTKNIFAYRMICKDTVEDKILKLQEKKRQLAAELITDEVGFVKALTKEDIEYLFS